MLHGRLDTTKRNLRSVGNKRKTLAGTVTNLDYEKRKQRNADASRPTFKKKTKALLWGRWRGSSSISCSGSSGINDATPLTPLGCRSNISLTYFCLLTGGNTQRKCACGVHTTVVHKQGRLSRVAPMEADGRRSCAWQEVRQCIAIANISFQVSSSELQSKILYVMFVMNCPWKLVLRLVVWRET